MIDQSAKIIDGKLCISTSIMMESFGVTRQALSNWAVNGCPKAKKGWWPLADVIAWRGLGGNDGSEKELSDGAAKLKYEAAYKRLQAEQLEFKNAVQQGEYVPREEIVSELSRYFVELKRSLMTLSRTLATQVAPYMDSASARRIENDMAAIINDALQRMADGEIYASSRGKKIARKCKT